MKRKAFTMLELVFVIVVLGILAALAMSRMERDVRQEAADNILSAIRYTQHMAFMDNVILPTQSDWQRSFWSFGTQNTTGGEDIYYEIGSDKNRGGNIDNVEAAQDPTNGLRLNAANVSTRATNIANGSSPSIFLGKQYGITAVAYAGGCNAQHIAFDYLGRPHSGIRGSNRPDFSTLINRVCTITFTFTDPLVNPNLVINILPETGYASVAGQPDL